MPRGLDPAYYFFTGISTRANRIAMIVDRRVHERRTDVQPAAVDQRAQERRAEPPLSWTRDGFLLSNP